MDNTSDLYMELKAIQETIRKANETARIASETEEKLKEAIRIVEANADTTKIAKLIETYLSPHCLADILVTAHEKVEYHAFSYLDFGRSWESTMRYKMLLDDGTVLWFGIGRVRRDRTPCFHITLPGGTFSGFLGKHRIFPVKRRKKDYFEWWSKDNPVYTHFDIADYNALRANSALWTACAAHFGVSLDTWVTTVQTLYMKLVGMAGMKTSPEVSKVMAPPVETMVMVSRWS